MYYTTYKKERRISAAERLIAFVEKEINTNKRKTKNNKKEGREDENYIK